MRSCARYAMDAPDKANRKRNFSTLIDKMFYQNEKCANQTIAGTLCGKAVENTTEGSGTHSKDRQSYPRFLFSLSHNRYAEVRREFYYRFDPEEKPFVLLP